MIIKLQNGDKVESREKSQARKKYREHSQLSIGQKLEKNLNIASSFLKAGPNITNFGNAIYALFGGYSPENPDVNKGDPPNVGIKDFARVAKTARVIREFENVLSKAPKTKEFIMPGLVGWAPKTKFKGYHASNEKTFIPDFFREGWAQKTHNAVKGIYIANGKVPGYGFLTKRKYVYPVETTFEKPQIQLGEVKGRTKNSIRNQIERDAQEQGADGIIFKGIADNQMQNQFIAKTLNPDTKIIKGPANLFQKSIESNDSKQNVFVQDKYGWKELSYPAYINHVWNGLKAKGIKTDPFNRSETNEQTLMNFFNKGLNPVFKLYPQQTLKAHAQEILRRMKNFGLDVDNTIGELPLYGKKSIRDLVTLNSVRTSYVGHYNKPGVTGTYFHNNGTSIVDPGYPQEDVSPLQSIVSTMHHERNMHGTQKFLTPEMWKPYKDLLKKIFPKTTTDEFGRTIAITTDNSTIPIDKGSLKKEELRATIGEMIKNIYDNQAYNRALIKYPNVKRHNLETLRPYFEEAVEEIPNEQLSRMLGTTNGYGVDYSEIGPKENPKFFDELRVLLKTAPATLPFLIPRKEKKK